MGETGGTGAGSLAVPSTRWGRAGRIALLVEAWKGATKEGFTGVRASGET